jgi:SnoaL-like domain
LQRLARAVAARDWEQWASLFAPDLVLEDHRPRGWGTLQSRHEYMKCVRTLLDLRPDARGRIDHVLALEDRRSLAEATWVGSRDDGPFEIPVVVVSVFGPDGRIQRAHVYDCDQLDAARACYEALAAPVPPPRLENAVTRLRDRFEDAWAARDWEGIAAILAPGFRLIDRRSYAHFDLDRDQELVSLRFRFDMLSSRTTSEVLATRGLRLALVRERFELADGDVGPSETESLLVVECDERGGCVGLVAFDPDALDAAYAELDRRHAGGEAAAGARALESAQRLEPAPATKP